MDIGKSIKKVYIDESQPIVGWRWWSLYEDGELGSLIFSANWKPPIVVADHKDCRGGIKDDAPELHHECGIYAFIQKNRAKKYKPAIIGKFIAFGKVKIFGNVVLHEFGVRGQYAVPVACWILPKEGVTLEECYSVKENFKRRYDGIKCIICRKWTD